MVSARLERPLDFLVVADHVEKLGWGIGYSDVIAAGKWNVNDVLRPIYQEASEVVGREFKCPGDE